MFKESSEFVLPNVSLIVDGKIVVYNKKEKIPNNEIWYTSNTNAVINPYTSDKFGANIISNVYENGVGIITFDKEVTSIGDYAFRYCSELTSITIPNSVTSIRGGAFESCSSLTSINIPNSVTSIGYSAFNRCSKLTSIEIPNLVTSLGSQVFYNCRGLTSVTMFPIVQPSLGSNAFKNVSSNLIIYVPDESVDAYKAATGWSSHASKIKPISEKQA